MEHTFNQKSGVKFEGIDECTKILHQNTGVKRRTRGQEGANENSSRSYRMETYEGTILWMGEFSQRFVNERTTPKSDPLKIVPPHVSIR